MRNRLMTSAELDAYETRWKRVLLIAGIALMVDLVYLFVCFPSGLTKFACGLIVAVSACACVVALKRLHKAGYAGAAGAFRRDGDAGDLSDVVDALTDLVDND